MSWVIINAAALRSGVRLETCRGGWEISWLASTACIQAKSRFTRFLWINLSMSTACIRPTGIPKSSTRNKWSQSRDVKVVSTLSIVTAEDRTLGLCITFPQVSLRAAFCFTTSGLFDFAVRPNIPDTSPTPEAGRLAHPI